MVITIITIVSENHFKTVANWAPSSAYVFSDYILISKKAVMESGFEELIEDIILTSNEVIGNSDKRKENIQNMMQSYKYMITGKLVEYLQEESYMNLDAFIKFRLWEYAHVVNLFLYALMKKELSTLDIL